MEQTGYSQTDGASRERIAAARFELLRQRSMLGRLDEVTDAEAHVAIIREAHVASVLAWLTPVPFLVFPCLFEERARAACELRLREARTYWRGLALEAQLSA